MLNQQACKGLSDSELENMSDLESLLNLVEEEFEFGKRTESKQQQQQQQQKQKEGVRERELEDCEIISVSSGFDRIRSMTCSVSASVSASFKQIIPPTAKRVQKSISEFFRAPKRIPETVEIEDEARIAEVKPFTFPPAKKAKDTNVSFSIADRPKADFRKYKVPKFKTIPKTSFSVDAFNYGPIAGISSYFLTHFHSDHYKGLSNKLLESAGGRARLYCSEVTGNLVEKELKIRKDFITTLKIGQIYSIEGVKVGVFDANHCPGSVMFAFGVPDVGLLKWHLHCGDFRADPKIILNQRLKAEDGDILDLSSSFIFESVYLDTTYAHPKHNFPSQGQVISACIEGCSKLLRGEYDPAGQKRLIPLKWMIAVGSYLIGKERIILAIAEAFDLLIYADARKISILKLLQWPELEDRLTDDPCSTPLHLVSMGLLSKQKLSDYRDSFKGQFSHVLGIRPTGWTFDDKGGSSKNGPSDEWSLAMPKVEGNAGLWPVPYSEHSSYRELEQFLQSISVRQVIPTVDNWADVVLDSRRVGGDAASLLKQWVLMNRKNRNL